MTRKYAIILLCSLCLTGCASLRPLFPGGVTAADAEWSGIKSGEPVSIISQINDPHVTAATSLMVLLGQTDPVGVFLPVTLIGETQPRWILCTGEYADKCVRIPLNANVHFAGTVAPLTIPSLGPGLIWTPSRLTADNFND